MTDKQSEGREKNDAVPVEEYGTGKGMAGKDRIADSESPQRLKEDRSFDSVGGGGHATADEQKLMRGETDDPNDLTGPAGDPAKGKRPGGSAWPA